jgi:small GTP-binding protein
MVRSGLEVAIVGPPNAGKSTLLNLLAQRDAAIVSDVPGTTRDVLEVRLDLGGVPVLARDTAGLRRAQASFADLDPVEAEGIRRAWGAAARAQLVLFVVDATNGPEAAAALAQLQAGGGEEQAAGRQSVKDAMLVLNKCDCDGAAATGAALLATPPGGSVGFEWTLGEQRVSCRTGDGVSAVHVLG